MNGRQKKKKFRKFILACEGYRKRREEERRENIEWRKDSRKILHKHFGHGQKYSLAKTDTAIKLFAENILN